MLSAADREHLEPLARALAEAHARARLVGPVVIGGGQSMQEQVDAQTARLMSDAEIEVAKSIYATAVEDVVTRLAAGSWRRPSAASRAPTAPRSADAGWREVVRLQEAIRAR